MNGIKLPLSLLLHGQPLLKQAPPRLKLFELSELSELSELVTPPRRSSWLRTRPGLNGAPTTRPSWRLEQKLNTPRHMLRYARTRGCHVNGP